MIDGRFDVYQLGWMLRKLTHYEAAPDIWTPIAPLGEGLRSVIARATGPFGERFRNAGELSEQLRVGANDGKGTTTKGETCAACR